jgi:hypothetical protein
MSRQHGVENHLTLFSFARQLQRHIAVHTIQTPRPYGEYCVPTGIALRQDVQAPADFCVLQTILPAIDT